jgi:hypothetical protein
MDKEDERRECIVHSGSKSLLSCKYMVSAVAENSQRMRHPSSVPHPGSKTLNKHAYPDHKDNPNELAVDANTTNAVRYSAPWTSSKRASSV